MSGGEFVKAPQKPLAREPKESPCDYVYIYDGSLAGFYCVVYESVYNREIPAAIYTEGEAQPSLFEMKNIETNEEKALKVRSSIPKKISKRALELVENVFLSCLSEKELKTLVFLLIAYRNGARTVNMLGNPHVAALLKAEKHLFGENHLLKGFIRFADYEDKLVAIITPKNFVLPFMANHFVCRYPNEDFMIFDKTHKAALVYENKKKRIIPVEYIILPEASEDEQMYQSLWKQFYKTIAIKERYNPKCQMTNMPKRYWENMTEMKEYL